MRPESLDIVRCPACLLGLELVAGTVDGPHVTSGRLVCACGRSYVIEDSIACLVHPETLLASDEEFRGEYDRGAAKYDEGLEWLFKSFYEDQHEVRSAIVDLLALRPGARVLEIGCGTGKDSVHIVNRMGATGRLYAVELSVEMLRLARSALRSAPCLIEYGLTNAAHLPFADRSFDAVFHFGGLNVFGDRRRGLAEMRRVCRLGGKVVVGDEGIPPWLRNEEFGRILINANPLYRHEPPLDLLPVGIRSVCLRWVLGDAFYLIDFEVADGPPPVDLDLPIPGKGDSLRSRFEKMRARE